MGIVGGTVSRNQYFFDSDYYALGTVLGTFIELSNFIKSTLSASETCFFCFLSGPQSVGPGRGSNLSGLLRKNASGSSKYFTSLFVGPQIQVRITVL